MSHVELVFLQADIINVLDIFGFGIREPILLPLILRKQLQPTLTFLQTQITL